MLCVLFMYAQEMVLPELLGLGCWLLCRTDVTLPGSLLGRDRRFSRDSSWDKYHEQSDSSKGFGCRAFHLSVVQKPMGLSRALTTGNFLPGCCGRASADVLDISMEQLGRGGLGNEQ